MAELSNQVTHSMSRKRRDSKEPASLIAGRAKRAYSGERLERLRRTVQRNIHSQLEELRNEIYELNQEAAKAGRIKAGSKKWLSPTESAQLDITLLRSQLKLLDRKKILYSTYLSLYKKFHTLLKFNPQRAQRTREYLAEVIAEINERTRTLVKAVKLQRQRSLKWQKFFNALKLKVSKNKALDEERKMLQEAVTRTKTEAVKALEKSTQTLKTLDEFHKFQLIKRWKYERDRKKALLEFSKKALEQASAEEALWIFWSHAPQKVQPFFVPPFAAEELARRRHNATDEKRRRIRLIERLS